MPKLTRREKKARYFTILQKLLDENKRILVVGCDNVGSNHMQKIRTSTRGEAVLLMGKKTMMRKAVRDHIHTNPDLETLLPHLHGNVGFVFTKGDLTVVRDKIVSLKVSAPAKAGTTAPNDVIVPAGNTGLEPTQTSFLQALNIASKINKGQVEIVSDVQLLKKGDKVGPSEAALLSKLNIKPFLYGLIPLVVYDSGLVYDQHVLDMTDAEVFGMLGKGVQLIAALGLQINYPTIASLPHSIANGFKNLVALANEVKYKFPQADKFNAAASAAPVAAAPAAAEKKGDDKKGKKKEEKKKEEEKKEEKKEEETEDVDLGLDLFA